MAFYDLHKNERAQLVAQIQNDIWNDLAANRTQIITKYFSDNDTYIRKAAYLSIGRIYHLQPELQETLLKILVILSAHDDFKIRQTVINAAGEIGKTDFAIVQNIFDNGLFDKHHSPRNAVIGSVKKMGEVNPVPVLRWARKYLHHED